MILGPYRALTPEYSKAINDHYPYQVQVNVQWLGKGARTLAPIDYWCEERYGLTAKRRYQCWDDDDFVSINYDLDIEKRWLRRITSYHFQDADHAFEFKMRWG